MWTHLDWFGRVLVDATLSTTFLLSVVVVMKLLSRQPARRITTARPAILLAALMIPLVSLNPLPRIHPLDWLGRPVEHLLLRLPDWCAGPWPLRVLSITYLGTVAIGFAWLLLGFWALWSLILNSEGPQPGTRELYSEVIQRFGIGPVAPELRVSRRRRVPARWPK